MEFEFTKHANNMLEERLINREWIFECLLTPDKEINQQDGTIHYIKAIKEYENRVLRVVVNSQMQPKKIVTFFFDRRLKK